MAEPQQLVLDWNRARSVARRLRPQPRRGPVEELSLDDWAPGGRPPRARTTDALSSHAAADQLERSGTINRQMNLVLELVRRFQGCTSKELAIKGGIDRYITGRRCSELERKGLVFTPDRERKNQQLRWWPVDEAMPDE